MAVLEVKELTKKYGEGESEVIALDHVSFSVERGEFVAIIGASGSGKSTLMNMIGGIDYPTSGSIIIDGNEIQAMSEDELEEVRSAKASAEGSLDDYDDLDTVEDEEEYSLELVEEDMSNSLVTVLRFDSDDFMSSLGADAE